MYNLYLNITVQLQITTLNFNMYVQERLPTYQYLWAILKKKSIFLFIPFIIIVILFKFPPNF